MKFSGEWVGQIANTIQKIRFDKTTETNTLVGMIWDPTCKKWQLMKEVTYSTPDQTLQFVLPNNSVCTCYPSEYLLTGSYDNGSNSSLGFQFSRETMPVSSSESK